MRKLDLINYNSRNELFKSHFGAVKSEKYVRFRVCLQESCGANFVNMLILKDGENAEQPHEMTFEWKNGDALYYKVDIKFSTGIYWYRFCYNNGYEDVLITRFKHSNGYISADGGVWQQTVYESDENGCNWMNGGLIYQIFPDRFYKSPQSATETPSGRYIRDDWGGQPLFLQPENDIKTLGNDFFGGNLKGITEKLPYIKSLGVTVIYLNPIFMASSNHRYNTMDYEKIDPMLGNEKDFCELCRKAHEYSIRIILDGVFSHTGDDSKYFDRYNTFGNGAASCADSKYRSWYKFESWPQKYHSWWGVPSLPEVNEDDKEFLSYICGKNGILQHWLKCGADGWRLDVADELPDIFLDNLRAAVKEQNPNAVILGEVWEDASNKISYGTRRRYLLGKQLDTVMNYPFANAIIKYVSGGDAEDFTESILTICENYPKNALNMLMNHIGTHDTARVLTALGFKGTPGNRLWQSKSRLNAEEYTAAVKSLILAAALQYALPGVPSLYYGDEAGMEGFSDPFCRGCYPWGNENTELLDFYKALGKARANIPAFKSGKFVPFYNDKGTLAFLRQDKTGTLLCAYNRWCESESINIPPFLENAEVVFGSTPQNGKIELLPKGFCWLWKPNDAF